MLDPAEVALRRIGEQPRVAALVVGERGEYIGVAHPQLWRGQRHVGDTGAARPRELPDAVDRVVVVGGQHKAAVAPERVSLAHKATGTRGVRREDDGVVVLRSVEVPENGRPGLLDKPRGRARRRVLR